MDFQTFKNKVAAQLKAHSEKKRTVEVELRVGKTTEKGNYDLDDTTFKRLIHFHLHQLYGSSGFWYTQDLRQIEDKRKNNTSYCVEKSEKQWHKLFSDIHNHAGNAQKINSFDSARDIFTKLNTAKAGITHAYACYYWFHTFNRDIGLGAYPYKANAHAIDNVIFGEALHITLPEITPLAQSQSHTLPQPSNNSQPQSQTEQAAEGVFNEQLEELIQLPSVEDPGEGQISLSPRDFNSFKLSGREQELTQLNALLNHTAPYRLQFIVAPSGAGKTRLATEWLLSDRVDKTQWQVGFVTDNAFSSVEQTKQHWRRWAKQPLTCNTLIVVDYIYRFQEVVNIIAEKGNRLSGYKKRDTVNRPLQQAVQQAQPSLKQSISQSIKQSEQNSWATPDSTEWATSTTVSPFPGENTTATAGVASSFEKHNSEDSAEPASPFKLRLLILDHLIPTQNHSDIGAMASHHKNAFGDSDGAILSNLKPDYQAPAMYLGKLSEQQHRKVLLPVIAQASGLPPEHNSVLAAYRTLQTMDNSTVSGNDIAPTASSNATLEEETTASDTNKNLLFHYSDTPVFSRFPLFAILIGRALQQHSVAEVESWQRSQLIGQYFTQKRLPWQTSLENGTAVNPANTNANASNIEQGVLVGLAISVATLTQSLPYAVIFDTFAQQGISYNREAFISQCQDILASRDTQQLKKYQPDILGESFCLLFLRDFPEICALNSHEEPKHNLKPEPKATLKRLFFNLLFAANTTNTDALSELSPEAKLAEAKLAKAGTEEENTEPETSSLSNINHRFIETIERMARNLCNDNPNNPRISILWQALAQLLHPALFTADDLPQQGNQALPLTASFACAKVLELLFQQHTNAKTEQESASFLAQSRYFLHAPAMQLVAEQFLRIDWQNYSNDNKVEHLELTLSALTRFADSSLNTNQRFPSTFEGCFIECLETFEQHVAKNMKHHFIAAWFNAPALLSWLLARYPALQINQKYDYGMTLLTIAGESGHWQIVQRLLSLGDENGALDINAATNDGGTALMFACKNGHEKVVQLLLTNQQLDINATDNNGGTALMFACHDGHEKIVQLLLKNLQLDINATANDGGTALMAACQNGHENALQLLLANQQLDINEAANDGGTALMVACQNGHENAVQLLLANQQLDINANNNNGATALIFACQNGHENTVQLLLTNQQLDINAAQNDGGTALMFACQNGHEKVVQLLLTNHQLNINATANDGGTALMLACQNGHEKVVALLLAQNGININAQKQHGATAIMLTVMNAHTAVVKLLLAQPNINLNLATTEQRLTAYHFAVNSGNRAIQCLLLASEHFNVNAVHDGLPPLLEAAQSGDVELVQAALSNPTVNVNKQTTAERVTALMLACAGNQHAITELLLSTPGIHLNQINADGWSALMFACHAFRPDNHNNLAIIKRLLAMPEINSKLIAKDGTTALTLTDKPNSEVLEQLLLAHGKTSLTEWVKQTAQNWLGLFKNSKKPQKNRKHS